MSQEPCELTAIEAAQRIARRQLTSEALVRSCLERIGAREAQVQAWSFLDAELALAQARACDRQTPRGPLHGVPVGIKDVLDTADMPSEYGSPIYRGHRPKADAACVAQLRAAGCVILGKTATTEFANIHPARTTNPHHPAHTPGGSSSGSAAGVADCMMPLALGTQTGGSIIRPAAYCGVVGVKPTFNSINRAGLKFSGEALDTIGVIARNVEDAALGLSVLSGRAAQVATLPARAPRIGLVRTPHWLEADAASRENLERAAVLLADAGATVSEAKLPQKSDGLYEGHSKIALYEAARALAWEYFNHADLLSPSFRPKVEEGWQIPRATYDAARALARECAHEIAAQFRDHDFLLTLSAPDEPARSLRSTGSSIFNRIWTLLGVPCVNLPFGHGPNDLPLGVQLVGRLDGDGELLAWAQWARRHLPWTAREDVT
jgi:Asp-tRNA(Asn)/Glu-tRNA(Gln) amidotransferase A subunit family amidase